MIVVVGADSVRPGRVAVGIARAQAMHRRVAVGDLFAESPPIRELVQAMIRTESSTAFYTAFR